MRFWDREKEVRDLKAHIESEPNSILFVYGPKSSGKSTLVMKIMEDMKKQVHSYFYDLRLMPISSYKDILAVFFRERGWKQKLKEAIPSIVSSAANYFEVDAKVIEDIFSLKLNPFEVMEGVIKSKEKKGKRVVIVFDELQKLKDVYINGERKFVSELFNFFVRLTKVLHLSHVIVMTSDTFFIEEVYTSSSLKNTSIYYLVDYFDDNTAKKILIEEGLSKEDADYIVNMSGGVPWVMAEVLSNGDPKEKITALYKQSKSRLKTFMMTADNANKIFEILRKVLQGNYTLCKEDYIMVKELVENEILFYDPINDVVRFQTKLDERAARELLKE